jgi:hypothetical protein
MADLLIYYNLDLDLMNDTIDSFFFNFLQRRLTNKDQIGGLWQQLWSMSGARDMIKQL